MKKYVVLIIVIFVILIIFAFQIVIFPIIHENECKNRVYEDMKAKTDNIDQSVIGIIGEDENNGLKDHNGIGAGVIFKRDGNSYYAVTAAHVVINTRNTYKVFTRNTEFSGEKIVVDNNSNVFFEIPDEKYYDALLDSNVEYISEENDIAIISFQYDGELPILEFENMSIEKDSKIMCIGHPEGKRYSKSYGKVISNIEKMDRVLMGTFEINVGYIMRHDAYLNYGNSGGVAISENMKIVGINSGATFNIIGKFCEGYMIPANIVLKDIEKWIQNKGE